MWVWLQWEIKPSLLGWGVSVVCNAHLSNESYLDWKTVNVIIILIVWKEMSTLTNMNECDTFHASVYLFRSLWHYFVGKKNECSPSRHQYCRWNPWAQRSGLDDCKRIPYGDRISSLFDILHSTNSQSFKNRIRHGERIQNKLFDWELPPPPPEKSSIYSTNCFEVISDTFSFLSDENQKNARRV